MNELLLLTGTQLFAARHLPPPSQGLTVLMSESQSLCNRLPFHQQKLGFVLSAMREHAKELRKAGYKVRYHPLEENRDFLDILRATLVDIEARRLLHFASEDATLDARIARVADDLSCPRQELPSPMFLLDEATVDDYFQRASKPRMAGFYKAQRLRLNLLVESGKPLGGKWSFDESNRRKLPKDQAVPLPPNFKVSNTTRECLEMVAETFSSHPGRATDLWLPTDRAGALAWLDTFLEERLIGFGTFEDAISSRSPTLFHSTLSPFLNVGLITPDEVVARAMEAADAQQVPLNDLEGFIRQVVGWREFIRGAYRQHGETMRNRNVWGGTRELADSWNDAATGLPPLDAALRTNLDYGWNHHIERLMVIANLMNLAEIHPQAVYRFFMANYIDAYDWVMVPNVFGMGLTSDGGIFTSKPYICGSNYIRKMSDHKNGDWADVMDGLYWRFVSKHRQILARNPRLAMITRVLDKMDQKRLRHLAERAEAFISEHTRSAA